MDLFFTARTTFNQLVAATRLQRLCSQSQGPKLGALQSTATIYKERPKKRLWSPKSPFKQFEGRKADLRRGEALRPRELVPGHANPKSAPFKDSSARKGQFWCPVALKPGQMFFSADQGLGGPGTRWSRPTSCRTLWATSFSSREPRAAEFEASYSLFCLASPSYAFPSTFLAPFLFEPLLGCLEIVETRLAARREGGLTCLLAQRLHHLPHREVNCSFTRRSQQVRRAVAWQRFKSELVFVPLWLPRFWMSVWLRKAVNWFWVNDLSRYGDAILNLTIAAPRNATGCREMPVGICRLRAVSCPVELGVTGHLPVDPRGLQRARLRLPPGRLEANQGVGSWLGSLSRHAAFLRFSASRSASFEACHVYIYVFDHWMLLRAMPRARTSGLTTGEHVGP